MFAIRYYLGLRGFRSVPLAEVLLLFGLLLFRFGGEAILSPPRMLYAGGNERYDEILSASSFFRFPILYLLHE